MIYDIIGRDIVDKMSKFIKVPGYGIGHMKIDDDGTRKVVKTIDNATGEAEFIGIDDSLGNYFYIRLTGSKTKSVLLRNQHGACAQEHDEQIPLTLVAVYECMNPVAVERKMKAGLLKAASSVQQPCMKSLKVNFDSNYLDKKEIFTRETGNNRSNWNSKLQLYSFDFILSYHYDYCQLISDPKLLESCQ